MASFASSATTGGARKHAWTNLLEWLWGKGEIDFRIVLSLEFDNQVGHFLLGWRICLEHEDWEETNGNLWRDTNWD